ncbi:oligosaccharide flippase family protein [Maribellus comscasis]|uniref:Oligosaccharide flippase family protein n=1 Tax=Maribellus comscasis TaxID=2681766 RepID=A0A6I6JU58_9BACT|nr:flippase [Maribellus comscasis]QGY46566.1 oligosaccharide flippase family protein [Maribellus comscasis]
MVKKIITYSRKKLALLDVHTIEVLRKSSSSMVVKVLGMIVGVFVSIFVGRSLGPDGLGIINLSNRIVSLLLVFTMLGMKQVLVKQIAIGYRRKDFQLVSDSIYTSSIINGFIALVLTILGLVMAPFLAHKVFHAPDLEIPLTVALIVMLPQTFSRVFGAALNGFRKIWQSNLVNETLSTWVVGILLASFFLFDLEIDVVKIAVIYAVGRIVVTSTMIIYWKRIFHFKGKRNWIAKPMLKMSLPMLLVSSTALIAANADTIMLGWLGSTREVGLYNVAARIALLVSFFLQISNSAISPKLAALFAENRKKEIEKMVKSVTSGLIIIATVSLIAFIFLGNFLLGLWGGEFEEAYWVLVILGIGQFFNISTGCAGLLLIMCGFEGIHSRISLIFVILNLILNYFFITILGALGAAIATAVTVSGENIVKLIIAKQKVGVSTIPLV